MLYLRTRISMLLVASLSLAAQGCGSADDDDSGSTSASTQEAESSAASESATESTSAETSSTETGTTETSTSSETGTTATSGGGAGCFPDGIYGECSENPTCQCLQGATVYQVCTQNCTGAAECGDASDFPGAVPGCFPLNPGSPDMICVLLCDTTADCPCGLECQPSGVPNTNLCAEFQ